MVIITCKISDRTFQGFEVRINTDYIDSKKDIYKQVKSTLVSHLEWFKFEVLANMAKSLNLHIHDKEIENILMMEENQVLWVCNH